MIGMAHFMVFWWFVFDDNKSKFYSNFFLGEEFCLILKLILKDFQSVYQ